MFEPFYAERFSTNFGSHFVSSKNGRIVSPQSSRNLNPTYNKRFLDSKKFEVDFQDFELEKKFLDL